MNTVFLHTFQCECTQKIDCFVLKYAIVCVRNQQMCRCILTFPARAHVISCVALTEGLHIHPEADSTGGALPESSSSVHPPKFARLPPTVDISQRFHPPLCLPLRCPLVNSLIQMVCTQEAITSSAASKCRNIMTRSSSWIRSWLQQPTTWVCVGIFISR